MSIFRAYVTNTHPKMLEDPLFETKFADIAEYVAMQLAAYHTGWTVEVFEEDNEDYPCRKARRWTVRLTENIKPGIEVTSYNPMTGVPYE